jgi:hypothetical protein
MKYVIAIGMACTLLGGCTSAPFNNAGYANANNNIAGHGVAIAAGTPPVAEDAGPAMYPSSDSVTGSVVQLPGQGGDGMPQSVNSLPPGFATTP